MLQTEKTFTSRANIPKRRWPAEFKTGDTAPWALRGIFILALFYTLHLGRSFFLPVTLAIILNFLLQPIVRRLKRWGVPPALGAALVLVTLLSSAGTTVGLLSDPATQWVKTAPDNLKMVEKKIRKLLRPAGKLADTAAQVEQMTVTKPDEPKIKVKTSDLSDVFLGYTRSFLLGAIEMIVLLYFLLASGGLFIRKLREMLPSLQDKKEAMDIAHEVEEKISAYLFTMMLIALAEGVVIGITMYFVGMPNPALLGVLAGLLLLIPYLGALVTGTVIALVALVTFDTVPQALVPPLIYAVLDFMQGNFITPLVLGKRLTLNPVVVFISFLFWGWIWGIIGIFLAVPILMTFKIFCDHLPSLNAVGEFLGE